jgi:hypothetical protein
MSSGGEGSQASADLWRGKSKAFVLGESSRSAPRVIASRDEVTGKELLLHGLRQAKDAVVVDDMLEFDVDEEVAQGDIKFLAKAHFFLGKKYNARGLFEEMKVAWGLHTMQPACVLGDNKFMLEFDAEETRRRIVEGGPWRHKEMPC